MNTDPPSAGFFTPIEKVATMAGIIQSLMSPSYEPEKITLDENDTVEGRTAGIIAKNSPLIQLANTRSKQAMNAKGTLNSSMAIQAGQTAVLDKALQIATPDAATSFAAKQSNQNAQNQAKSQKLAGDQSLQQISASGSEQRQNIGAQTESESRLIAERGAVDKELQSADIASRKDLLNRQAQIDTQLQELRGAQNIEGIVKAGEVQTASESRLIAERGALEKQLQTADITARKEILERQAEIDAELQRLRGSQSLEQIGAQANSESRLIAERGEIDKQLQTADIASRKDLLDRQAQIDTQLQQLRGAQSIEQIGAQTNSESRLIAERGQIERQLQTADLASREQLLNRQAQIDTQLQQLRGEQSLQQIGAQSASESRLIAERGQLEKDMQTADIDARKIMLDRQAQIDTQLQELRGAQNIEGIVKSAEAQTASESRLIAERGNIEKQLQTADIGARKELLDRQAQIDTQLQQLRGSQSIDQIGAQTSAESRLIAERGELDKQMQTADFNGRQDLMAKQEQIDIQLQKLRGEQSLQQVGAQTDAESRLIAERGALDKQMQTADVAARKEMADRQAVIDTELQKLRGQQNIEGIVKSGDVQSGMNADNYLFEKNLQQLRGEQAKQLSELETRAGQISQATSSVAVMSSQVNESLAAILSNPDMPPETKDALVQKQIDAYRAQLGVIGGMTSLDLTALLDFSEMGETGTPPGWSVANPVTPPSTTPVQTTNPTTTPAPTPTPASAQDPYQMNLGAFSTKIASAFPQGQAPTEEGIIATLDEARRLSISSQDIYKGLLPIFPGVSYNAFLNALDARGYLDLAADGL